MTYPSIEAILAPSSRTCVDSESQTIFSGIACSVDAKSVGSTPSLLCASLHRLMQALQSQKMKKEREICLETMHQGGPTRPRRVWSYNVFILVSTLSISYLHMFTHVVHMDICFWWYLSLYIYYKHDILLKVGAILFISTVFYFHGPTIIVNILWSGECRVIDWVDRWKCNDF